MGRHDRLINLSARKETFYVESLKFGEGVSVLIPSEAIWKEEFYSCDKLEFEHGSWGIIELGYLNYY